MKNRPVIEMEGLTDTGQIRALNEDAIAWDARMGLAVVADGMGGHNAGEVASEMAVRQVRDRLQKALALSGTNKSASRDVESLAVVVADALRQTNRALYEAALARSDYAGMGSTVVVAVFVGRSVTIAHVGDSRAYRLRDNLIEQLTVDHSLVEELVQAGLMTREDARYSDQKNVITRALGVSSEVDVDVQRHWIRTGDVYLLCSDGLTNLVDDDEISTGIRGHGSRLKEAAKDLVRMANERGGHDNVSVVLVRVTG